MNEDVKSLWVSALRSEKYTQGMSRLKTYNGKYCCLGVLCELYREKVGGEWTEENHFRVGDKEGPNYLLDSVKEWAQLDQFDSEEEREVNTNWLATLNDNGENFSAIAKVIEEKL